MTSHFRRNARIGRGLLLAICLLAALASGCSQRSADSDNGNESQNERNKAPSIDQAVDPKQKGLLAEYRRVVKGAKEAAAIVSYLNEHLLQADRNTADTMIRELNAYYHTDLQRSQEQFFQGNVQEVLAKAEWPITAASAASIPDENVKQLVATKLAGGYKLVSVEGMIYPIVDYESQKTFKEYLSEEMLAYVDINAKESNEPSARDAGLVIGWDELAGRAVSAEAFIAKYPDSPEREEIEHLYLSSYLSMYIYGLNNTPVFALDTFKLKDEVKASYEKTVRDHPESVTARTVSRFLDVLESTDWQVFEKKNGRQADIPEVKRFHDSFRAEAKAMLR